MRHFPLVILTVFLFLQLGFWGLTHDIHPTLEIVPEPPTMEAAKALSLGDEQFYFRKLAFDIQNAGDSFGRFTSLKLYDYAKVAKWFQLLDQLDAHSNFAPSLASYYYSQTPNREDVRYMVDYLEQHVKHDPETKWWWLLQATYLANHKLEDKSRALQLAIDLTHIPGDRPLWTYQLPAFIHAELGEKEAAFAIMMGIVDSFDEIQPGELRFMEYFIRDRLGYVKSEMAQFLEKSSTLQSQ